MLTWQTSFESHRALRIEGRCDLGRNLTFFNASMHPLGARRCCQTCHGRGVGYGGCDPHGASHNSKTFNEYVQLHIVPYLDAQIQSDTKRIDAVWDNYPEEKLSRSKGAGMVQGQESAMAALKTRSVNGTVAS